VVLPDLIETRYEVNASRDGGIDACREPVASVEPCTLRELVIYFARLGTFGFGGPIALAGYMQRDAGRSPRWCRGAAFVLGRRALVDVAAIAICIATFARSFRRRSGSRSPW
jgi:hypothetical protein